MRTMKRHLWLARTSISLSTARGWWWRKSADHQTPIDRGKELPLKNIKFRDGYAAHLRVEIVRAENVAEAFA